jgi:hypothetical protein
MNKKEYMGQTINKQQAIDTNQIISMVIVNINNLTFQFKANIVKLDNLQNLGLEE